jgi:2'-5' RNA ligase
MDEPQPLILTLQLDPASFATLDALRRAHFPRSRNLVPAHVTLFHALPGAEEAPIAAALAGLAEATAPLDLVVARPRFLGRGVAFDVESPALLALRGELARGWAGWLSNQDRQRYKPHVTIQNKVAPEAARALFAELEASWRPLAGRGAGLLLWRYRGGPWEAAGRFPFGA